LRSAPAPSPPSSSLPQRLSPIATTPTRARSHEKANGNGCYRLLCCRRHRGRGHPVMADCVNCRARRTVQAIMAESVLGFGPKISSRPRPRRPHKRARDFHQRTGSKGPFLRSAVVRRADETTLRRLKPRALLCAGFPRSSSPIS
jgi:hypothetical protein